jgi:DNA ligase-1
MDIEEGEKMIIKTLYKLDTKGKTRILNMHLEGDSYYTSHGILNGKIITDKPTKAVPKNVGRANATTAEEQALLEAEAKITKKVEEGYHESIHAISLGVSFFEPMLAQKFNEKFKPTSADIYSQPKLDGIRAIARRENGEVVLRTRNGKVIVPCEAIERALSSVLPEDVVLDGELYNHEFKDDFNKIVSLVKKSKPDASEIQEANKLIQYHVYDVVSTLTPNMPFSHRLIDLARLESEIRDRGAHLEIKVVPTLILKGDEPESINAVYEYYLKEGYEGQMIRLDTKYENKRSNGLLKRKEFLTEEFEVVSINEGIGNRAGTAGNATLKLPDGRTFNSNIKGDREFISELLVNRKSVEGKMATVVFFNYTPDGIPRFPFVHSIRDYE